MAVKRYKKRYTIYFLLLKLHFITATTLCIQDRLYRY